MSPKLPDEWQRKVKEKATPKRRLEVVNMAGITPRKIPWLWWPYLPLGKLVIVAGAPGHGKSQFSALIAALATRGALAGDVSDPSRVLMLCAEDDLDTTVVPRLLAVNADVRLVDTINVVTDYPTGFTVRGLIKIPSDFEAIHMWARDNPTARLVVMDPVASFFGRDHNTLFNQDVRDALAPLVGVAETYGMTVVIVLHLNKSETKEFSARIAESHGFQALARSIMALGPDPDDPLREKGNRRVIALTKSNLVKPGNYSMRCEVRSVVLNAFTPPVETSELVLTGRCDITADDLLASSGDRSDRIESAEWLAEFIGAGWRKVNDVRGAAQSDGWSWRVIDRVARSHGFQRVKQPGVAHGPWWLGAPEASIRHIPRKGLPSEPSESSEDQPAKETQDDPSRGRSETEPSDNGKQDSLDDYRRLRDRMLGERDEDDEDA